MNTHGIDAGRVWAYIGTIVGVTVSAAANLIETLNNDGVPAGWTRVAAGFMSLLPVGLFIALEVLVRNRIKEHLVWWRLGMGVAALAFAIPSYLHMHWLLISWGQGEIISWVTPFGWDALMLLSTLALLLDPNKATESTEPAEPTETAPPEPAREVGTPTVTIVKAPEPSTPPEPAQKPRTRRYLARQEDHPLYAHWKAEFFDKGREWEPADFARKDDSTLDAARRRLARWHKDATKSRPEVEASNSHNDERVDA